MSISIFLNVITIRYVPILITFSIYFIEKVLSNFRKKEKVLSMMIIMLAHVAYIGHALIAIFHYLVAFSSHTLKVCRYVYAFLPSSVDNSILSSKNAVFY